MYHHCYIFGVWGSITIVKPTFTSVGVSSNGVRTVAALVSSQGPTGELNCVSVMQREDPEVEATVSDSRYSQKVRDIWL